MSTDLTPRVRTARSLDDTNGTPYRVLGTHFGFGMRNLNSIAREFGVERSNAKDATILRGCDHVADQEVAQALSGHQFLVHCKGRETPTIFSISDKVQKVAGGQVVSGLTEFYYDEATVSDPEQAEAIKYKIMFKKILAFSKVVTVNANDNDLVIIEVTTQKGGEGAIDAIFRGATEEADVYLSITEVTDFDFDQES
jgi:hypothetical protein